MPGEGQAKTAFVFAGGGSFGAIQVGMLHSLVSHGIAADMVFGSSVGALNGAYYAGAPTLQGVRELEAIWRSLRRQDIFPVTWRTLLGFVRRRDFLVTPDGLRKLINTHLPYRNLEDAKIPIHVIATDILSAETVVLSKGPACEAILASAAIPAAFAPVQMSDLFLADGAISSNTPVRAAVARGAQRLIILPTGYACARQTPPVGAVANALHALTLLIARQLISELECMRSLACTSTGRSTRGVWPQARACLASSTSICRNAPAEVIRCGNASRAVRSPAVRSAPSGSSPEMRHAPSSSPSSFVA
jgi:NTE family protein